MPPPLTNYTVRLSAPLSARVARAMMADGFSLWAEFCRVALTEKCQAAELLPAGKIPIIPRVI